MLFILLGLVIVWIAILIIPKVRLPGSRDSADLGWMSAQWLAEHRASHSR